MYIAEGARWREIEIYIGVFKPVRMVPAVHLVGYYTHTHTHAQTHTHTHRHTTSPGSLALSLYCTSLFFITAAPLYPFPALSRRSLAFREGVPGGLLGVTSDCHSYAMLIDQSHPL